MKYLDELKKLDLPKDKYAVFGSGPLAIIGLRENRDIDLIVKEDLYIELERTWEHSGNGIKKGNIEAFKDWQYNMDVDKLINEAEEIEGIMFVTLDYVLEWKQKRKKEKDIKDIELIKADMYSGI